jgi:triacylglycerol lipase
MSSADQRTTHILIKDKLLGTRFLERKIMRKKLLDSKIWIIGNKPAPKVISVFLAILFWVTPVYADSSDTIVLIHGFLGWGRSEMFEVKYWGGIGRDYEEILNKAGYETVSVAVGPVSSNWDRAIEAYYQLKGGCVDYGFAHAKKYGHERFGRCYEKPLLPQWGKKNKINIIAHSQGGQTARLLVHLLEFGSDEEKTATGLELAEIFKGNHPWVKSVTTLATPHNGTTLTKGVSIMTLNMAEKIIKGIAGLVNASDTLSAVYDYKLDQWGLKMQTGQTYKSYLSMVKNSPILEASANKDLASWDLSPEGARELNSWVKTSQNVYYFSVSTDSTEKNESSADEYPIITNALILFPSAIWLGIYRNMDPKEGEIKIDDAWAKNDGVVNTVSMKGPEGSKIETYNGKAKKGVWEDMGTWSTWDHMDIIGHTWMWNLLDKRNPKDFYLDHAKFLNALN